MPAAHHVILGHHILALQHARLAHARLWCKIHHIGVLKPWKLGAGKLHQPAHARPALHFRRRQILTLRPESFGICGQLSQITPGSGVFSHQ